MEDWVTKLSHKVRQGMIKTNHPVENKKTFISQ